MIPGFLPSSADECHLEVLFAGFCSLSGPSVYEDDDSELERHSMIYGLQCQQLPGGGGGGGGRAGNHNVCMSCCSCCCTPGLLCQ